ncbi:cysteine-rich protein 2-binding protein isoform X2 [Anthonomus grandis grandis]|uniref:cysteine-rich protein 2-binding protein isoform X2 n=1 Tax=Anthonomus grandis grandis TaxID=2921223 RepID=UPI0021669BF0|nr:cysteine-rich protein 2-binding protein isoform X2 [Anthonomus grandis grandis]
MEEFLLEQKQKICKYCGLLLVPCLDEGLECTQCQNYVHLKCLKRGSVPGGLEGDVFYIYTCLECSDRDTEKFVRQKISWLQALVLALYHLQTKSGGLGNNGFFHWRHHIVSFVDRHSDIIFPNEKQRKKKWVGTIAGRLSHYSGYLFVSGSKTIFNKPAWWTLMYPKITPGVLSEVYNALNLEKQRVKLNNEKKVLTDAQMFHNILTQYITDPNLTQTIDVTNDSSIQFENIGAVELEIEKKKAEMKVKGMKRKQTTPFMVPQNKKLIKLAPKSIAPSLTEPVLDRPVQIQSQGPSKIVPTEHKKSIRLIDPMCYYNTSLSNISRMKMLKMTVKLTGNTRKEMILSPYSGIYLKPYIRRDTETFPNWLKLMAELQLEANKNNAEFVLPPRAPIDYSYVQPEHIPAINSLCNQFFWPGIDRDNRLTTIPGL